jgi:hypothetical protein
LRPDKSTCDFESETAGLTAECLLTDPHRFDILQFAAAAGIGAWWNNAALRRQPTLRAWRMYRRAGGAQISNREVSGK